MAEGGGFRARAEGTSMESGAGWGVPWADQMASGRVRGLWPQTLLRELRTPTKAGLQRALQPQWDWGLHWCVPGLPAQIHLK